MKNRKPNFKTPSRHPDTHFSIPTILKSLQRLLYKKYFKRYFYTTFVGLMMWGCCNISSLFFEPIMPTFGQAAEIYSNQTQQDLRKTFLSAIDHSKSSILLIIYSLREPNIISALRNCAESGIKVTVICDKKASFPVARELGPSIKTYYRDHRGLMHQKILVVDDSLVFMGSANMTGESLRHHANLVIGVENNHLAQFINSHAKNMLAEADSSEHVSLNLNGQEAEMWFLPDSGEGVVRLKQLLSTARKTIRIAMFTWTHPELTKAVIDAHNLGIQVECVIDRSSATGSSQKVYQHLKEAGISVAVNNTNTLLHHKFVLIDEDTLVNGSANWTKAAFSQNDDCFLILKHLTHDQQKKLADVWRVVKLESIPSL